jgi:hypothetical protein
MTTHIILFQDANFNCAYTHVCDTESNLNASDDHLFNDRVSSVVVLSGNWKFFRNPGFDDPYPAVRGAGPYRFVGDVGIGNGMSSLTHVADPPTVTGDPLNAHAIFLEQANFHGGHRHDFAGKAISLLHYFFLRRSLR